jgi:hypothetical protein
MHHSAVEAGSRPIASINLPMEEHVDVKVENLRYRQRDRYDR